MSISWVSPRAGYRQPGFQPQRKNQPLFAGKPDEQFNRGVFETTRALLPFETSAHATPLIATAKTAVRWAELACNGNFKERKEAIQTASLVLTLLKVSRNGQPGEKLLRTLEEQAGSSHSEALETVLRELAKHLRTEFGLAPKTLQPKSLAKPDSLRSMLQQRIQRLAKPVSLLFEDQSVLQVFQNLFQKPESPQTIRKYDDYSVPEMLTMVAEKILANRASQDPSRILKLLAQGHHLLHGNPGTRPR